jgi:hypothetical protein
LSPASSEVRSRIAAGLLTNLLGEFTFGPDHFRMSQTLHVPDRGDIAKALIKLRLWVCW